MDSDGDGPASGTARSPDVVGGDSGDDDGGGWQSGWGGFDDAVEQENRRHGGGSESGDSRSVSSFGSFRSRSSQGSRAWSAWSGRSGRSSRSGRSRRSGRSGRSRPRMDPRLMVAMRPTASKNMMAGPSGLPLGGVTMDTNVQTASFRVNGIRINVVDSKAVKANSVHEITTSITYMPNGSAHIKGPESLHLGAIGDQLCLTCFNTQASCPSHPGHMSFTDAVVAHPMFLRNIVMILQCLCHACGWIRLTRDQCAYVATLPPRVRLKAARNMAARRLQVPCENCGLPTQPTYRLIKIYIVTVWQRHKFGGGDPDVEGRGFTADMMQSVGRLASVTAPLMRATRAKPRKAPKPRKKKKKKAATTTSRKRRAAASKFVDDEAAAGRSDESVEDDSDDGAADAMDGVQAVEQEAHPELEEFVNQPFSNEKGLAIMTMGLEHHPDLFRLLLGNANLTDATALMMTSMMVSPRAIRMPTAWSTHPNVKLLTHVLMPVRNLRVLSELTAEEVLVFSRAPEVMAKQKQLLAQMQAQQEAEARRLAHDDEAEISGMTDETLSMKSLSKSRTRHRRRAGGSVVSGGGSGSDDGRSMGMSASTSRTRRSTRSARSVRSALSDGQSEKLGSSAVSSRITKMATALATSANSGRLDLPDKDKSHVSRIRVATVEFQESDLNVQVSEMLLGPLHLPQSRKGHRGSVGPRELQGHFRGNLNGKRRARRHAGGRTVRLAASAMIQPQPHTVGPGWVGIPLAIALRVTVTEDVTRFNVEDLRKRVIIGATRLGGANVVVMPNGERVFLSRTTVTQRIALAKMIQPPDGPRLQPSIMDILSSTSSSKSSATQFSMIKDGGSGWWKVVRVARNGDDVFVIRPPVLHPMNIMAKKMTIVPYLAMRVDEKEAKCYGMDFDGDMKIMHMPMTIQARADMRELMDSGRYVISTTTGTPIIVLTLNGALGTVMMCQPYAAVTRAEAQMLIDEASRHLTEEERASIRTRFDGGAVPPHWAGLPADADAPIGGGGAVQDECGWDPRAPRWLGRQIMSLVALPPSLSYGDGGNPRTVPVRDGMMHPTLGEIDENTLFGSSPRSVLARLCQAYGNDVARRRMAAANSAGMTFLRTHTLSMSVDDVVQPPAVRDRVRELSRRTRMVCKRIQRTHMTAEQKETATLKVTNGFMSLVTQVTGSYLREHRARHNSCSATPDSPMVAMTMCKGSDAVIAQHIGAVTQQVDHNGRRLFCGATPHTPMACYRGPVAEADPAAHGFVDSAFGSIDRHGRIGLPVDAMFQHMAASLSAVLGVLNVRITGELQRILARRMEDIATSAFGLVWNSSLPTYIAGSDALARQSRQEPEAGAQRGRVVQMTYFECALDVQRARPTALWPLKAGVTAAEVRDAMRAKGQPEAWTEALLGLRRDIMSIWGGHGHPSSSSDAVGVGGMAGAKLPTTWPIAVDAETVVAKHLWGVRQRAAAGAEGGRLSPQAVARVIEQRLLRRFDLEYVGRARLHGDRMDAALLRRPQLAAFLWFVCPARIAAETPGLTPQDLVDMCDRMVDIYHFALVPPKSAVGMLIPYGLGEKLTQDQISSFHGAGIGEDYVPILGGAERTKELVKVPKLNRTPVVELMFKPGMGGEEARRIVREDLGRIALHDVLAADDVVELHVDVDVGAGEGAAGGTPSAAAMAAVEAQWAVAGCSLSAREWRAWVRGWAALGVFPPPTDRRVLVLRMDDRRLRAKRATVDGVRRVLQDFLNVHFARGGGRAVEPFDQGAASDSLVPLAFATTDAGMTAYDDDDGGGDDADDGGGMSDTDDEDAVNADHSPFTQSIMITAPSWLKACDASLLSSSDVCGVALRNLLGQPMDFVNLATITIEDGGDDFDDDIEVDRLSDYDDDEALLTDAQKAISDTTVCKELLAAQGALDFIRRRAVLRGRQWFNSVKAMRKDVPVWDDAAGTLRMDERWCAQVVGPRSLEVLLHAFEGDCAPVAGAEGFGPFDARRSTMNDVWGTYKFLGIEAMRRTIYDEICKITTTPSVAHIMLFCDAVTSCPDLFNEETDSSAMGNIIRVKEGFFATAITGQAADVMAQAALHGERDRLVGNKSRINAALPPNIGSGGVTVHVDTEYQKRLWTDAEAAEAAEKAEGWGGDADAAPSGAPAASGGSGDDAMMDGWGGDGGDVDGAATAEVAKAPPATAPAPTTGGDGADGGAEAEEDESMDTVMRKLAHGVLPKLVEDGVNYLKFRGIENVAVQHRSMPSSALLPSGIDATTLPFRGTESGVVTDIMRSTRFAKRSRLIDRIQEGIYSGWGANEDADARPNDISRQRALERMRDEGGLSDEDDEMGSMAGSVGGRSGGSGGSESGSDGGGGGVIVSSSDSSEDEDTLRDNDTRAFNGKTRLPSSIIRLATQELSLLRSQQARAIANAGRVPPSRAEMLRRSADATLRTADASELVGDAAPRRRKRRSRAKAAAAAAATAGGDGDGGDGAPSPTPMRLLTAGKVAWLSNTDASVAMPTLSFDDITLSGDGDGDGDGDIDT